MNFSLEMRYNIMKAHIARNQNAGVPLALGWNLSAADRGIL